jgi:lipoyl-dependent peroxiredoxin
VPRIERSASVSWEGNVARGRGEISADTGAFRNLPYSLPTRIGQAEGKTSPEELLAAAHGGCLAMSLASELSKAGKPADRLDVHTTIRMDEVEGQGHQIVASAVRVRGAVPGLPKDAWERAVAEAHESCSFSALLRRAGADVTVNGELEED